MGKRARKRVPWSVTDSLHEKSYISEDNEEQVGVVIREAG